MEEFLDRAEILLRDIARSRDIATIVVLHHLRDLSKVLDNLKLYDECRLTGNCALDLAEALGRRSLEFRHDQAETLALIAGLSVYRPRARTLFIQAVSICEEVVENNPSYSNKHRLLIVLDRAGYCASGQLRAQWLGHAIQLMTKELPPTMVHPGLCSVIYNNYGNGLRQLRQYSSALDAYHEAISIRRVLVNNNPAKNNLYLAEILMNMGVLLSDLGKYDDAIVAYKETLEICMTMSVQDILPYNVLMAKTHFYYGVALWKVNQVSEAAAVEKRAISLLRSLAQTSDEFTKSLSNALHNYGNSCGSLGQHAEAVIVYQESILLRRALAATDSEEEENLTATLHDMAVSFSALHQYAEANMANMGRFSRVAFRPGSNCHSWPASRPQDPGLACGTGSCHHHSQLAGE